MPVNLNRSPVYTDHNIPINPNNYYRGLNADSYESLWSQRDDGTQVMKGYGKGGTDLLSFQAGHPNELYVNGIVKSNVIIEGTAAMPIEAQEEGSGYTFVREISRSAVESGEIPLRIYTRTLALGEVSLKLVDNRWSLAFSSFPEDRRK